MFTAIVWTVLGICGALVLFGLIFPFVLVNRCEHIWEVISSDDRSFTKKCRRCNKTKMEKRA